MGSQVRHQPGVGASEQTPPGEVTPPWLSHTQPRPGTPDPAIAADVCTKVLAALDELPAKLRVTVRLAMIEERPYAEIADALGISTGTGFGRSGFGITHVLRRYGTNRDLVALRRA